MTANEYSISSRLRLIIHFFVSRFAMSRPLSSFHSLLRRYVSSFILPCFQITDCKYTRIFIFAIDHERETKFLSNVFSFKKNTICFFLHKMRTVLYFPRLFSFISFSLVIFFVPLLLFSHISHVYLCLIFDSLHINVRIQHMYKTFKFMYVHFSLHLFRLSSRYAHF